MASFRRLSSGRWQALVRRRSVKTSKTFRVKAAAERWAKDTEDRITAGKFHVTDVSLPALIERYKREVTPHKKGAKPELYRLGVIEREITSLTVESLVAWAKLRCLKVAQGTLRRELSTLSAVLDTARVVWGLPIENTAKIASKSLVQGRVLRPIQSRTRRLSPGEETALLLAVSPKMGRLIRFALETAMRRGELSNMDFSHITGNMLLIPESKTDKARTIPLSPVAVKLLGKGKGKVWPWRTASISTAFARGCVKAGIKGLRFHDLRHEAISRLFEKGLSIEEVAIISGHASWSALKGYTHPSLSRIAEKL